MRAILQCKDTVDMLKITRRKLFPRDSYNLPWHVAVGRKLRLIRVDRESIRQKHMRVLIRKQRQFAITRPQISIV